MKKLLLGLLTVMLSQVSMASRDCQDTDSFTKIIGGHATVKKAVLATGWKSYSIIHKGQLKSIETDKYSRGGYDLATYQSFEEQENHTVRIGRYILVDNVANAEDTVKDLVATNLSGTEDGITLPYQSSKGDEFLKLKVYRSSGDLRDVANITIGSIKNNLGAHIVLKDLVCAD